MYLVELTPGKETVYRDQREFTAAIARGEVSAQSRIYHRRQSTWLPVTVHPQFRRIAATRSSEPAPPPPRAEWTFLRAESTAGSAPPADAAPKETADATAPAAAPARRWRKMFEGLIGHH